MGLAHFTNLHYAHYHDDMSCPYNPTILIFNETKCDKILKLGMPSYPHKKESSLKATYGEDDNTRNLILKEKPKDINIEMYDREGTLIRRIMLQECDVIELPNYEIEIKYNNFEDFYF